MKKTNLNVLYGLIFIIIIFLTLLTYSFLGSLPSIDQNADENPQQIINRDFSFRAAIIDHLSVSDPSPWFIETATNILKAANFTVDYYPREKVTINLYRNLAASNYGLIIFRVHSGREPVTFFFSGEYYNGTAFVPQQLNDQIGKAWLPEDEQLYFSIKPLFVKYAMTGSFYKTVIIALGCGSLSTMDMAEAFIEKGAAVYIGWDRSLDAFHGDLATLGLLNHLLLERSTVNEAVQTAMEEVGPVPSSELGTTSTLSFYPIGSGNYRIPYSTNFSQTSNP
jgi:hypothetical protein